MNLRTRIFASLLCLAALTAAGCRRNIVRAAPPSVAPPPAPGPMPQPTATPQPAETTAEQPPVVEPEAAAPSALKSTPPKPRPPVEAEAPKPKTDPEPAPPQIVPELSPRQLADAQRRTNSDIVSAEHNLQLASGKQLNAEQNDLVEKIRGFLGQAHEAVMAADWVRAQNLSHKAQILSGELVKSLQ